MVIYKQNRGSISGLDAALGSVFTGSSRSLRVLLLMAATVLVNPGSTNPYPMAALAAWRQGHFLNFNRLARLTARF